MHTKEVEFKIKNENQELNRQKITRQSTAFKMCLCSSHLEASNWSWGIASMSQPKFVSHVCSIQVLPGEWLSPLAFCLQAGNDLLGGHTLNSLDKQNWNVFLAASTVSVPTTPNSSVGFTTLKKNSEDERNCECSLFPL